MGSLSCRKWLPKLYAILWICKVVLRSNNHLKFALLLSLWSLISLWIFFPRSFWILKTPLNSFIHLLGVFLLLLYQPSNVKAWFSIFFIISTQLNILWWGGSGKLDKMFSRLPTITPLEIPIISNHLYQCKYFFLFL